MFHAFTFVFLRSCLFSALPKDEGACFAIIRMYYYDNGEKICRMFFTRRLPRKRQPFDSREHCQTFVSVFKSRFAIFKQYNVNNVKLNS